MAKRSLLGWFDRGNQRSMDYIRSQPESGIQIVPYAKSDSARHTAVVIIVVVGLIATILDWRAGVVAWVVAAPLLWRLEHHFFFGSNDVDDAGSSEKTTGDSAAP
jgi:hypothetical protein